jgi:protein SCO1/2
MSWATPYCVVATFVALFGLAGTTTAHAQRSGELPAVFDGVGLDQRLGRPIPDTLVFFDESGRSVRLADYLAGDKPLLLNFAYHTCEMLCGVLLTGLTGTLQQLDWTPGQEFEVLTVSFSAADTPADAAEQKQHYVGLLGRPEAEAGWHFLTGSDASIHALADAVGFRYKWVEEIGQYAHPAVLTLLTADGRISRYIEGLSFDPGVLRLALMEASEGTVGSPLERLALFCLKYDPTANSYVPHAVNIMKLGGLLTVLVIGLALALFWRSERARLAAAAALK